jgi:hypothetical protein
MLRKISRVIHKKLGTEETGEWSWEGVLYLFCIFKHLFLLGACIALL